jgi:predicted ATP-dependent endonuclease of OLD family
MANDFSDNMYSKYGLHQDESNYQLRIKTPTESHFPDQITVHRNDIALENLGLGERVLLAVESSMNLTPGDKGKFEHIFLIEEPENHLSYLNMHKLLELVEKNGSEQQTFITTHNNMIASRLDLSHAILFGDNAAPTSLKGLDKATADYFVKAPDTNILNFILAKKAILVEGNAEYILLEKFYEQLNSDRKPFQDNVTVISCGGKTFERYLEVAQLLEKTVAVITDNDKDYQHNIADKYKKYSTSATLQVFSDECNENYTFEVCLYNVNKSFYDNTFSNVHMTNGVLEYMLNNKAEAALKLLESYPDDFTVPNYITKALTWINTKNE